MKLLQKLLCIIILISAINAVKAQFLMDVPDTTLKVNKGILNIYQKNDLLKIGVYLQPQFQVASAKGISTFEGTDFAENVSNRFMMRRSRMRIDYVHYTNTKEPGVQIVFQFDANERGFTVRDVWGRVFENSAQLFSFTAGMFARPFGFETNLSSSDRESPERGRMNQLLMRSERDLGAMITFDARKKIKLLDKIKIDVGLFNGQGITANGDFDNIKDLIARFAFKPIKLSNNITLTAAASYLYGGLLQNTKYKYYTATINGIKTTVVDSSAGNLYNNSPRHYAGADAQLKICNKKGLTTELRTEFIAGKHSVTANSNETPTALLTNTDGFYIRYFNGAYFYLVKEIFNTDHQLLLKYDWFDPNTKVAGKEIGAPGSLFSAANIKYSTLGMGYIYHLNSNVKLTIYYAKVWNEHTALTGFTNDVKDDVFTTRLQFRF